MTATATDNLTLFVESEIDIDAPIETTFDALLEQLTILHRDPGGATLTATLEARPGGRWFRDLGDDNGHLWGHVQVIKRPMLLEIQGPLFMSYPALNHIQYKLESTGSGTRPSRSRRACATENSTTRLRAVCPLGVARFVVCRQVVVVAVMVK